jgi:hypothetical protein
MTPGTVLNVSPGKSVVRLRTGEVITARNALNLRTPPRSKVLLVKSEQDEWSVIGRKR